MTSQMTWHGCAHSSAWRSRSLSVQHGGVVALALRYPELPSAIVMIDAPVVRPDEGSATMQRFLERLRVDYQEAMHGFVSVRPAKAAGSVLRRPAPWQS